MTDQSNAIRDLHVPLLDAWRGAGLLSACENLGDRKIHRVTAWNAFVERGIAAVGNHGVTDLAMAALPRTASLASAEAVLKVAGHDPDIAAEILNEDLGEAAVLAAEKAFRSVYSGENALWMAGTCMQCDMTNARLSWGGTAFAPILQDSHGPAARLMRPRAGCHLVLDAPSGTIVLLPSPSESAIVERALDDIAGPDNLHNHSDAAMVIRTKAIFERYGAIEVTISARFSSMIRQGDITRFASLRQDHEPAGLDGYRTQLWGPLLIDKGRLEGLIRDGSKDEDSATKTMAGLLADKDTLEIEAHGKTMHVYFPAPGSETDFGKHFKARGLAHSDRIQDQMILSRSVLDVSSDLCRDLDWRGPDSISLADLRRAAAERAYEDANFEGMEVGGTGGWEDDGDDRLVRKVFLETGAADTEAMSFSVAFPAGSAVPMLAEFDLPEKVEDPSPS